MYPDASIYKFARYTIELLAYILSFFRSQPATQVYLQINLENSIWRAAMQYNLILFHTLPRNQI